MTRRIEPLHRYLAGLLVGLAIAHAWPDPHIVRPALGASGGVLILCAVAFRRHAAAVPVSGIGLALLLWVAHGGLAPPPAEVAAVPRERTTVVGTVHGLVERTADQNRFSLHSESLDGHPVRTTIHTTVYGDLRYPPLPGDRVRLDARVRPPRAYKNPGVFDYRRWRAREGIHWQAGLPADRMQIVAAGVSQRLLRLLQRFRDRRERDLRERFSPETAALVAALTLGTRGDLSPEVRQSFIDSGTAHLLAISGLHVGLLATYLFALSHLAARRTLPVAALRDGGVWAHPQGIAAAVALAGVLAYTVLSGAHTSTRRAALMIAALLVAPLLGRRSRPGHTLCLAAIFLLCLQPQAVGLASFQLSFAAVAGILLAVGGRGRPSHAPWEKGKLRRLAHYVVGLARATGGAWLATAPLVWWHFGQVAPAGLLVNLPAIPLLGLALLPCALVSLVVPAAVPIAGPAVTTATEAAARTMLRLVEVGSGWRLGHFTLPPPTAGNLVGLGVLMGLAVWWWIRRPRIARVLPVMVVVAVATVGLPVAHPASKGAEIVVLDVGQGDSILVRTGGGHTILVDGGGTTWGQFDVGAAVVVPALRALGIGSLDVVAVSHPQADHMGGLAAVLERMPVGVLWDAWHEPVGPAHAHLLRLAARRGIPVVHPVDGFEHHLDDARLLCLHPPRAPRAGRDPNTQSMVLMVETAGRRLLLTGDIDRASEVDLVGRHGQDLACDLLKLAHHGSRTSSSSALLRAAHPAAVLISVGEMSPFGHPHPVVLRRIARVLPDTAIWRTDLDGQLRVHLTPEIAVEPHPAPSWVRTWSVGE
ncbi:MAG: DNA internalization-related competence protein ComEC/Rec2 [Nitrospirota bacterium]|jgi:competence protein ComEC